MVWNTAIGGAIIAAGVSLFSLINSKEAKISEFRQQWIDALREDLATLVSAVFESHGADESKRTEAFNKANLVTARIALRLNNGEDKSHDLQEKLDHLRDGLHDINVLYSETAFEQVETRANLAIDAGKLLLKSEWKRVKSGEPTYRWTRGLILICFAFLSLLFLFDFLRPDLLEHASTILRHWAGYHV
jgi:hypothetical protein